MGSDKVEVVCGMVEARCRCTRPPHEDDVHVCDCGGSWRLTADGEFTPLNVPGAGQEWNQEEFLGGLLGAIFGFTDEDDW